MFGGFLYASTIHAPNVSEILCMRRLTLQHMKSIWIYNS